MFHTIVTFDELVLVGKRLLIRKILNKIAEYYTTLENPILKEFSEKIYLNLENLTGGCAENF